MYENYTQRRFKNGWIKGHGQNSNLGSQRKKGHFALEIGVIFFIKALGIEGLRN